MTMNGTEKSMGQLMAAIDLAKRALAALPTEASSSKAPR